MSARPGWLEGSGSLVMLSGGSRFGRAVLLGHPEGDRAALLARRLQEHQLLPTLAFTPAQVLGALDAASFDALLLHLTISGINPRPFFQAIRARSDAEIIAIGADPSGNGALDRVVDEWLPEEGLPGAMAERVAEIVSIGKPSDQVPRLCCGPLSLDPRKWEARWDSRPLALTPAQFHLLEILVRARGDAVSYQSLSRALLSSGSVEDRGRVYAHIRRIRKKIEVDPSRPRFLLTIPGGRFRLAVPALGAESTSN